MEHIKFSDSVQAKKKKIKKTYINTLFVKTSFAFIRIFRAQKYMADRVSFKPMQDKFTSELRITMRNFISESDLFG